MLYAARPGPDRDAEREPRASLVEGYLDCLMAHQHGFGETVAALGTAFTPAQLGLLRRYADEVVALFDADAAGQKAAARAEELLEPTGRGMAWAVTRSGAFEGAGTLRMRVALLPAGHDPDTFLRSAGGEGFNERIAAARSSCPPRSTGRSSTPTGPPERGRGPRRHCPGGAAPREGRRRRRSDGVVARGRAQPRGRPDPALDRVPAPAVLSEDAAGAVPPTGTGLDAPGRARSGDASASLPGGPDDAPGAARRVRRDQPRLAPRHRRRDPAPARRHGREPDDRPADRRGPVGSRVPARRRSRKC